MLDHVNIVVSDIEVSVAFYKQVLQLQRGFERILEGAWIETLTGIENVRAHCVFMENPRGGARLELLQFLSPDSEMCARHDWPATIGVRHIAWNVDDIAALLLRLEDFGGAALSAPIEVPFAVGNLGRKKLCYFRDPDGVLLEAAAYEKV